MNFGRYISTFNSFPFPASVTRRAFVAALFAAAVLSLSWEISWAQNHSPTTKSPDSAKDFKAKSSFKVTNMVPDEPQKVLTNEGPVEAEAYYIVQPKGDQQIKSPVKIQVGMIVEQTKRPDLTPVQGQFFVRVMSAHKTKKGQILPSPAKGLKIVEIPKANSTLAVDLKPGLYLLSPGFMDKSNPSGSGGWVSHDSAIEVVR